MIAFVFIIVLTLGPLPVPAFDVIPIVGEVNDSNQVVLDGEIYEVDDTPQGAITY